MNTDPISTRFVLRSHRLARFAAGVCLVAALGLLTPVRAPAQVATTAATEDATPITHPNDPMMWNVDRMMEDAVMQISKRYSLNKEQERFTRILLTQRVRAFLKDHEADVRMLLKESIDARLGLKEDTADVMQSWAKRAKPLYEEAMKAILDGNKEWGDILTDEQKKIHLNDLNQMNTNFDGVKIMLTRWEEGKGVPGEFSGRPRQSTSLDNNRTASGARVTSEPPRFPDWTERKIEDMWETYVQMFIKNYGLDEKQANSARAIHKESVADAAKYRDSRKADFEALKQAGGPDPKNPMKPEELRKRKQMLEKPIKAQFIRMHDRLEGLLSAAQREGIKPDAKAALEAVYKSYSQDSMEPIPVKPAANVKDVPPSRPGDATAKVSATTVPAETEKAVDSKPEPAKADAPKSEAPKAEPAKGDAAKPAESSKPEPPRSEPVKSEPAKEEAPKGDDAKPAGPAKP